MPTQSSQTIVHCHNLNGPSNCSNEDIDVHSGGSDSTLTLGESDSSSNSVCHNGGGTFSGKTFRNVHSPSPSSLQLLLPKRQIEKVDEVEEDNFCGGGGLNDGCCALSLCLWKDPLYEDWGFSLGDDGVDATDGETDSSEVENSPYSAQINSNSQSCLLRKKTNKQQGLGKCGGAIVADIRRGGPAAVAGLRPSDRIMEVR